MKCPINKMVEKTKAKRKITTLNRAIQKTTETPKPTSPMLSSCFELTAGEVEWVKKYDVISGSKQLEAMGAKQSLIPLISGSCNKIPRREKIK